MSSHSRTNSGSIVSFEVSVRSTPAGSSSAIAALPDQMSAIVSTRLAEVRCPDQLSASRTAARASTSPKP